MWWECQTLSRVFQPILSSVQSGVVCYNEVVCQRQDYRSKLDRWPCHVTLTQKKAIFSAVTPFSKKKLGQQVDPIRNVTHVTNGVLGQQVDPIRNVILSQTRFLLFFTAFWPYHCFLTVFDHDLGHKIDPIRNVTTSQKKIGPTSWPNKECDTCHKRRFGP